MESCCVALQCLMQIFLVGDYSTAVWVYYFQRVLAHCRRWYWKSCWLCCWRGSRPAFPVSDAVAVFWYLLSACCSTHFLIPCICIDVVVSVHFAVPDRRVSKGYSGVHGRSREYVGASSQVGSAGGGVSLRSRKPDEKKWSQEACTKKNETWGENSIQRYGFSRLYRVKILGVSSGANFSNAYKKCGLCHSVCANKRYWWKMSRLFWFQKCIPMK